MWVCLQRPEEIGMQQGRILEYMPSTMLRQYLPATAAGMMNQLDERERERERERELGTKERERVTLTLVCVEQTKTQRKERAAQGHHIVLLLRIPLQILKYGCLCSPERDHHRHRRRRPSSSLRLHHLPKLSPNKHKVRHMRTQLGG